MMVRMFAHRNFDAQKGDVKKAHALVCETCNQPLWKHHALICPVDRRNDQAAGEVQDFLRRAEDWPKLKGPTNQELASASAKYPHGPIEWRPVEVADPIVGIVNFNGRVIVATSSGVFELINNELHRIPLAAS